MSDKIEIKILGPGCKNCTVLYENTRKAVEEIGLDADMEKVTDYAAIAGYGIMSTPGLVVNKKVVSYGKVLKPNDITKLLKEVLK